MTFDMTPENDRPAGPWVPSADESAREYAAAVAAGETGGAGAAVDLEARVRGLVRVLGRLTHNVAGHPDIAEHWNFTPDEVGELAPPLASLVNRSDVIRRAVEKGDIAEVVIGLIGWTLRNLDLSATIAEETAALAEPVAMAERVSPPPAAGPVQPWDQMPVNGA